MSKSIILHQVEAAPIGQRAADGYIDATAMCRAVGKHFGHYAANASTKEFLDELSRSIGIPMDLLIVSVVKGRNEERGTWVHPDVAVHLAQWCSPKFAVAVARWVREWMLGPKADPERLAWEEKRSQGKTVRKDFCGVLAAHGVQSPEDFSHATNAIYSGTLGRTAKELRAEMGLKKSHSIRDQLKGPALIAVALAEHATATRIEWAGDTGQDCIRRARQVAHEIGRVLDPAQHLPEPKKPAPPRDGPISETEALSIFAKMRRSLHGL